jgi:hypothetical protein
LITSGNLQGTSFRVARFSVSILLDDKLYCRFESGGHFDEKRANRRNGSLSPPLTVPTMPTSGGRNSALIGDCSFVSKERGERELLFIERRSSSLPRGDEALRLGIQTSSFGSPFQTMFLTSEQIGRAMLAVVRQPVGKRILESKDIRALVASSEFRRQRVSDPVARSPTWLSGRALDSREVGPSVC